VQEKAVKVGVSLSSLVNVVPKSCAIPPLRFLVRYIRNPPLVSLQIISLKLEDLHCTFDADAPKAFAADSFVNPSLV
jgi:hypothetical protein